MPDSAAMLQKGPQCDREKGRRAATGVVACTPGRPRFRRPVVNALFGQVVFAAGGRAYWWEDAFLAAMWWGDWDRLVEQARQGLACARHLEEGDGECDPDQVSAAADEFRYARDLLTVEETEAWLARWGVTADAWMDAIQRSVLRQLWTDDLDEIGETYPVSDDQVAAAMHAEGVCSGAFPRFAWNLAARAAAYDWAVSSAAGAASGEGEGEAAGPSLALNGAAARAAAQGLPGVPAAACREKLGAIARLECAFQRFSREALTPKAIRDAIATHHLDWIGVRCRRVAFDDEPAAHEAALCVREDGDDLAAVAGAARAAVREARFFLDETEPPARDAFLSARTGDLLGPMPVNGGFSLFQMTEKIMPSPEDPDVRRRAEQHVLDRAIDREVTHRIRWHFPL